MTENEPGRSLRRKIAFILAINVLALVLIFVGLEVTFRLIRFPFSGDWTPSENAMAQFDSELGWTYRPGISRTAEYDGRPRTAHFNARGFRAPTPDHRFDPDRPTVLFVGGSYTMGHGLDWKDTFAARFEAGTGRRYQSVNLGVQAYGTDQALLCLKRHLEEFRTKAVVYTFCGPHLLRNGIRDRRLLIPAARFLGTKPQFGLASDGRPVQIHRPVLYEDYWNSWVFDFARMRFGDFPPLPAKLTRALVREMGEYCAERGVTLIVLNWRWDPREFNGFRGLGVTVVDLLALAPPGWGDLRIPGDGHPNPLAARIAADILAETFRRMGLL